MNWYYLDTQQKQIGPISEPEIQNLASSGKLTKTNMVWNETLTEWTSVAKTPLAAFCSTATPPPVPPPAPFTSPNPPNLAAASATSPTQSGEMGKTTSDFLESVRRDYKTSDLFRMAATVLASGIIFISLFIPFAENSNGYIIRCYNMPPFFLGYLMLIFVSIFAVWVKRFWILRWTGGLSVAITTYIWGSGSGSDGVLFSFGMAFVYFASLLILTAALPDKWFKRQDT